MSSPQGDTHAGQPVTQDLLVDGRHLGVVATRAKVDGIATAAEEFAATWQRGLGRKLSDVARRGAHHLVVSFGDIELVSVVVTPASFRVEHPVVAEFAGRGLRPAEALAALIAALLEDRAAVHPRNLLTLSIRPEQPATWRWQRTSAGRTLHRVPNDGD